MLKTYTTKDWNTLLTSIPAENKDVHYTREFYEVFRETEKSEFEAFVYETEDNLVFLPFFKRRLGDFIPYTKFADHFDVTSAYGYGGPVVKKFEEKTITEFFEKFHQHCLDERIVTSFIRLHPLINNEYLHLLKNTINPFKIVFVDTTKDIETLHKEFKHSARKSVRKAKEAGVEVKRYDDLRLDEFKFIYDETMSRNHAGEYYLFSEKFFKDIETKLNKQFVTYIAYLEGKPISAELVLISDKYSHSFLGGTLVEFNKTCANSLIKYHVIKDATEAGTEVYLLGGGRTHEDNIFGYKSAFAPQSSKEFYIDCEVHNDEVYGQLIKEWEDNNPGKVEEVRLFQRYMIC